MRRVSGRNLNGEGGGEYFSVYTCLVLRVRAEFYGESHRLAKAAAGNGRWCCCVRRHVVEVHVLYMKWQMQPHLDRHSERLDHVKIGLRTGRYNVSYLYLWAWAETCQGRLCFPIAMMPPLHPTAQFGQWLASTTLAPCRSVLVHHLTSSQGSHSRLTVLPSASELL
jgi:hypothetical protein